jgi:hypothetical protein
MHASDWLALSAFLLSLAAFAGNTALSWLKWPRITVDVSSRASVYIPPLVLMTPEEIALQEAGELQDPEPVYCDTYDTFTVAVVNNGAEPFTIRTIGLIAATKADRDKWRGMAYTDYEVQRDKNAPVPSGPELPARIEGHDVKLRVFHNHLLGVIPRGTKVAAYADRYKVFRWWPQRGRSVVRRSVSDREVNRSGTTHKAPPQGNIPPALASGA